MDLPSLADWGNFYVITGSAAAALTGLMFVVIALRRGAVRDEGDGGVRAFGTPTVLHFSGVLLIAAILSVPHRTATGLALSVGAIAVAGLALSTWVVVAARRQVSYAPVLSDWVWHVALPLVAYSLVAVAALLLPHRPAPALDLVATGSLILLFIGIHNAWDAAVWIASRNTP